VLDSSCSKKKMTYYLIKKEKILDGTITIDGDEFRHIVRVIRLGRGDKIYLIDGESREYSGIITSVGKDALEVKILAERILDTEPAIKVALYQGLIKGEKFDWLVQKIVELGVSRIVPIVSQRTVVKTPGEAKRQRWEKIIRNAVCVSGRGEIPEITSPMEFLCALRSVPPDEPIILFWEECESKIRLKGLRETMQELKGSRWIHIFVGPEGGFTAEEVGRALERGARIVNLGPRILKSETAAIAAVSLILYEMGDM